MSLIKMLSVEPNPVGEFQEKDEIKVYIEEASNEWSSLQVEEKESSKWNIFGKSNFVKITKFLIYCLDGLIMLVDRLIEGGPNKKATVLLAISDLYDYVVKDSMPMYAKPFAANIKNFVIYTIISIFIDYIVSKYREGSWSIKEA